MNPPAPLPKMSPDEYLVWEREQPVKHEYVAGQVFAMSGATDAHATVTLNVATMLRGFVRGGACRVYVADMKAHVAAEDAYYYPDILVTCDERDRANALAKEHPRLIVEVLSPSTAAFDRGLKFAHYRTLASLEEYVLIDPERRSVECFRRDAQGRWVLYPFGPADEVELASLGFRCSMDAVYEDVELA